MRYNKLDLNLLIALRALLAEKSVTRAGELVHLTQPAMSGVLARLREYFDDPLIVQVGRKSELTTLAKGLVEPVNDVLQRIEANIATRPAFSPARTQREFTLVASEYVARVLLFDVLTRVRLEAPGLTAALRQPIGSVADELESGGADFVVMLQQYSAPTHSAEVLFEDYDTVLVDASNKVVGDTITLQQFLSMGHAAHRNSKQGALDHWYEERYQRERRIEVTTDSFYLLPHLILGTDRIATLPSRIARQLTTELPLRAVTPLFEIPQMIEVLQWPKHHDYDAGSEWLRTRMREAARALPPLRTPAAIEPAVARTA